MRRHTALLLAVFFTACASVQPLPFHEGVAERLFCGLLIPDGGEVSEEEWRSFVRDEVTPRFPDGLTLWRAEGQWRGSDGVVRREPVLVIEIVRRSDRLGSRDIVAIAEAWKSRFRQEAVLRVTTPARMQIID